MEYLSLDKVKLLKKGICTHCNREVDGFEIVEGFFCKNTLQNTVLKCPLCDTIVAFFDTCEYFSYTEEYPEE